MTDPLRDKQLGVARGMGIGLGITLALVILWGWRAFPDDVGDRLRTLGAAATMLGLWLAAGIGNVARLRFFSASAIDAGIGDDDHDIAIVRARAVLQNTLEQALVAVLAYAALALVQDRSRLLIVGLVAAFSVGRTLFWAGYAGGATSRALGFALTFYPSVAGLLVALISALRR